MIRVLLAWLWALWAIPPLPEVMDIPEEEDEVSDGLTWRDERGEARMIEQPKGEADRLEVFEKWSESMGYDLFGNWLEERRQQFNAEFERGLQAMRGVRALDKHSRTEVARAATTQALLDTLKRRGIDPDTVEIEQG